MKSNHVFYSNSESNSYEPADYRRDYDESDKSKNMQRSHRSILGYNRFGPVVCHGEDSVCPEETMRIDKLRDLVEQTVRRKRQDEDDDGDLSPGDYPALQDDYNDDDEPPIEATTTTTTAKPNKMGKKKGKTGGKKPVNSSKKVTHKPKVEDTEGAESSDDSAFGFKPVKKG